MHQDHEVGCCTKDARQIKWRRHTLLPLASIHVDRGGKFLGSQDRDQPVTRNGDCCQLRLIR
jgi:hypothetical protein